MVFNSNIFLLGFFPVVFALFWLSRSKQQRYVLLTVSGYVFYGYWNWRFCFLLLFSSLVSFFVALLIENCSTSAGKRGWMITSVAIDLSILGFFKYYNFFASSARCVIPGLGIPQLDIVLPIGISFYTFHTISYIVDVAAGRVKATNNLFEYLTYVSLFSQLVAGPIVRFRQIEQDLKEIGGAPREEYMALGTGFFVVGLIKKVIIADQIAALINPMIASLGDLSQAGAWFAALGYTFQLYYDFSGYSDMAIGLGYLFGLRIPQNFNTPYQAHGVGDFWRRWHISLSTWLRDYLYIPLGGNRRGLARTYVNLMITMLLGGLWHGANWTFVIWGAFHGILLILDRALAPRLKAVPMLLRRGATFFLVVVSWVIFRSDSLPMAMTWLGKLAGFGVGMQPVSKQLIAWVVACLVAVNVLPASWDFRFGTGPRWAVVYALGFFLGYLFLNGSKSVYIYYQF